MKFDVIIGNPPYHETHKEQMLSSAQPIFYQFVEKSIAINPQLLVMIIPTKWYAMNIKLASIREKLINDKHIKVSVDIANARECFPCIELRGGVCYFLRDKNYIGDCTVHNIVNNKTVSIQTRKLNDNGIFIRYNQAISIYHKTRETRNFSEIVSRRNKYRIESNYKDYNKEKTKEYPTKLYMRNKIGYVNIVDKDYKVYLAKAYGGSYNVIHRKLINKPILGEPNTVCSDTYLVITAKDKEEALNIMSYIKTRFFRFMTMLKINSQNLSKDTFSLVPMQDFTKPWTDKELYKKYNLLKEEINFIEIMVKECYNAGR